MPILFPLKSSGFKIPASLLTYIDWWRKKRDGKTGIAINGGLSWFSVKMYEDKESSETSNS